MKGWKALGTASTMLQLSNRKRIYSNAHLPIPDDGDSDCLPSFGGTLLMPAAIANLALLLQDGVAKSAAAVTLNRRTS